MSKRLSRERRLLRADDRPRPTHRSEGGTVPEWLVAKWRLLPSNAPTLRPGPPPRPLVSP